MDFSKLQESINKDLSKRKKELTEIYFNSKSSSAFRRCFVVLAYAHLEGFLKHSIKKVLIFLNEEELEYKILIPQLSSLILFHFQIKKENPNFNEFHSYFERFYNEKFKYPDDESSLGKLTTSNISFKIFNEILIKLGFSIKKYELNTNFFDKMLLQKRNSIAHGNHIDITINEVDEINEKLHKLLDVFSTDIFDYILEKKYLLNSHSQFPS
jgi:hypothetical protein